VLIGVLSDAPICHPKRKSNDHKISAGHCWSLALTLGCDAREFVPKRWISLFVLKFWNVWGMIFNGKGQKSGERIGSCTMIMDLTMPLTERSFLWSTKFQPALSHLISRTYFKWLPALPWETRLGSKVIFLHTKKKFNREWQHISQAYQGCFQKSVHCWSKCVYADMQDLGWLGKVLFVSFFITEYAQGLGTSWSSYVHVHNHRYGYKDITWNRKNGLHCKHIYMRDFNYSLFKIQNLNRH